MAGSAPICLAPGWAPCWIPTTILAAKGRGDRPCRENPPAPAMVSHVCRRIPLTSPALTQLLRSQRTPCEGVFHPCSFSGSSSSPDQPPGHPRSLFGVLLFPPQPLLPQATLTLTRYLPGEQGASGGAEGTLGERAWLPS